jgi:uncharacterized protein
MPGNKKRTGTRKKKGEAPSRKASAAKKASKPKPAGPTGECICLKVHVQGPNRLVAACDGDILGCTFKGKEARLEVSKAFYFEEMVDAETLIRFLRTATMANLVGKNVVHLALEAGFIDKGRVLVVEGVPHAQLLVCM